MSFELKFNMLQGGVLTLDVPMTATFRELKSMLVEKHQRAEDPIESKLLRVELLRNSSIMEMEDAQTLGATGLLEAEEPTTVIYKRNEAEASTKDDVHALGFFHLNIPSYCKTICDGAFRECQNLVSVTITESVTHIGDFAFSHCTSLASITLGESVTDVGSFAFRGCTSLASISLGESVTHIANYAFEGCTSLASITLGESVTLIGHGAFDGCTSLASITLGESVTHIGNCAFRDCTSLASITLGESVTHIENYAFQDCTSLASITLGESVTHIGDYAFEGCASLASITLGESVTHIGYRAFKECTSLASITVPESLKQYVLDRLRNSSVAIMTIPARKGRKRPRNEWVSLQMCYGPCVWSEQPITSTTCGKHSGIFRFFSVQGPKITDGEEI